MWHDAVLENNKRARWTPPQRRAVAIRLAPGTLGLVPRLRRFAESLLEPPTGSPSDAQETVAVRAVLGTIVWSGLTLPGLFKALSVLRRDQLDLDDGVLVLTIPPFPTQRFHLDPRSTALWAWLLLLRAQEVDWRERPDALVLPEPCQDPMRLKAKIQRAIVAAGLGSSTAFARAVQLLLACDGVPPVVLWHRAGHVFVTPAPLAEAPALVEDDSGPMGATDRKESRLSALVEASPKSKAAPWRECTKRILRGLRRRHAGGTRQQMASDLERLVRDPGWTAEAGIVGQLFCQWAITLLRSSRCRSTVRAYLSRVGRVVDVGLLTDAIVSSVSVAETTACLQSSVELYQTHESRRSVLRTLRAYLVFASDHGYLIGRQVKWRRIARSVGGSMRAEPLLSPSEIRRASSELQGVGADGLTLAAAVVLAGCAGLRRAEICNLTLDDVQQESEWMIRVRRSKTRAGARRVPLGTMAPSWALDILKVYSAHRTTLETNSRNWLLNGTGTALDPDSLGKRVARVLQQVSEKPATFHSLRRACATWWLVCWLSHDRSWPLHPMVAADEIPGEGVLAILGNDPTLALWSLARLLGHVTPAVTVERYFLAMDWLEAKVFSNGAGARITSRMAAEVLTVTERRARDLITFAEGFATLERVLAAQRWRLRLLGGRR